MTDEFYALEGGGFLVTMMGGPAGHHPGRVVEFDKHLRIVAEHPAVPPDDGFNPHGISVRPELNLMVTSDFICQEGDHEIHVAQVRSRSLVLDSRFNLDFDVAFGTGPARPHGMAFK